MSGGTYRPDHYALADTLRKLAKRLDAGTVKLRFARPFVFEGMLSFVSSWAGWVLITDQAYFDKNLTAYGWIVENVTPNEWVMGACALMAGVLKAVGMVCLLRRSRGSSWVEAAYCCRQIGWSASAVFWTLIAVSVWVGAPRSIGATLSVVPAVQALLVMLSGPAMPEGCKNDR